MSCLTLPGACNLCCSTCCLSLSAVTEASLQPLRFPSEFSYGQVPEGPLLKPRLRGHGLWRLLAPKMCPWHGSPPGDPLPTMDLGPGV